MFKFPNDGTIHIEDQSVKRIRNDDKLTIYEHPPDIKDKGSILSELRLHRTFFSRQFHYTAPSNICDSNISISSRTNKKFVCEYSFTTFFTNKSN